MRPHALASLILVLFVFLALSSAAAVPLFEASDEAAHFLHAHHLAETGTLPDIPTRDELDEAAARGDVVAQWSIETHQPPLYYALGALLISGTARDDITDYLRSNDLIFTWGRREGNPNQWLHPPTPPRGDTHTAVWTLRLFSLALACGTLWCIYRAAHLATGSAEVALTAMLTTASIPTFAAISASVNNDNLVTFLSAAAVFWTLRVMRHGLRKYDWAVIAAIVSGIALTKFTGLSVVAVIALGLWFSLRGGTITRRQATTVLGAIALFTALNAGWWYARNWSLHGDPLALEATQALWGRDFAVASESGGLLAEIPRIWQSFWLMIGHLHQPVWGPGWFYISILIFSSIASLGFLRYTYPDASRKPSLTLITIIFAIVAILTFITATAFMTHRMLYFVTASSAELMLFKNSIFSGAFPLLLLFVARVFHQYMLRVNKRFGWPDIRTKPLKLDSAIAVLILAAALPIALLIYGTRTVDISYGRLLYPGLVGIVPLLTLGLWGFIGRPGLVFILVLFGMTVVMPYTVIRPAYPPLEVVSTLPPSAIPLNVRIDGSDLTILGYEPLPRSVTDYDAPPLTLYLTGMDARNPSLTLTWLSPRQADNIGQVTVYPGMAAPETYQSGLIYKTNVPTAQLYSNCIYHPAQDWSCDHAVGMIRLELKWQTDGLTTLQTIAPNGQVAPILLDGPVFIDQTEPRGSAPFAASFGGITELYNARLSYSNRSLYTPLFWRIIGKPPPDLTLTVQIFDAAGEFVTSADGDIAGYPARVWIPGTAVIDERIIALPDDLPTGTYTVAVGWYTRGDLARLPVSAETTRDNLAVIGTFEVIIEEP